jgi:hypothetical protein
VKAYDDRGPAWLVRRLARVGPREAVARLRRARWWARVDSLSDPAVPAATGRWLALPAGIDAGPLIARAEQVLAGEWRGFGGVWQAREQPILWNRDPGTGAVLAPVRADRVPRQGPADVRAVWEAARHHPLVWLAQAAALTDEPRFAEGLAGHLTSFFDQCPFPRGPCWTSALEVAVRTANWAAAWQLAADRLEPTLRTRWARAALRGLALIEANRSVGSSANNHLVGELGGLVLGGAVWAPAIVPGARARLEAELLRQIAPDGSSAEGAPGYLAFSLSWGLLAGIACGGLADAVEARLAAAAGFLGASTVGGQVPALGDSDDGIVLQLGPDPLTPAAVGRVAAAVFGLGTSEEARWWTARSGLWPRAVPPPRHHYPDGGHLWLGGTGPLRALLVAAPIGPDALGAHAHADALSLLLWHRGAPLLIDPGTGSYLADPTMRAWFRSTAAHNTAAVDGRDSSEASGAFQWSHRADVEVLASSPTEAAALHRGYERLPDPVVHERRVRLDGLTVHVEDTLRCAGAHEVVLAWHLGPGLAVRVTPEGAEARADGVLLAIGSPADDPAPPLRLARGVPAPEPMGWRSSRFGAWEPSDVLTRRVRITGTTSLRTTLTVTPIS